MSGNGDDFSVARYMAALRAPGSNGQGGNPLVGTNAGNIVHRVTANTLADYVTQRTRSRSPRREYRERSRSRSRDNYRSRRERSPENGHYEAGYSASSDRNRETREPRDRAANKEQMMSNIRESSQQERRVYVGNLSYDVKWHHLKDFMRQGKPH